MLRVAVDATPIPGQRVGVGIYVTELLRAIDDQGVDLHVFANARDAAELAVLNGSARLHTTRVRTRPLRLMWAHTLLPLRARSLRPDVFHGLHYTLPARVGGAGVVTFHDPTFFTHAHLHERAKVAYFGRAARDGVARATRVIAVSEYAKRGAVEHAGADPDKVDVVYEGVDIQRFHPAPDPQQTPHRERPCILFVGAIEPRKDVPTLIEACRGLGGDAADYEIVLVGPRAWGADAVDEAVATLGPGRVRMTGYVPEAEKIALYRGASVFVYPSIAEGFGLPVLEAMACGTPVVTTTGSAPEEIAGDAALLVPPKDPTALRETIARVLSDNALSTELRRRGPERARNFTWTRAAAGTVDVWKRAAGARQ